MLLGARSYLDLKLVVPFSLKILCFHNIKNSFEETYSKVLNQTTYSDFECLTFLIQLGKGS